MSSNPSPQQVRLPGGPEGRVGDSDSANPSFVPEAPGLDGNLPIPRDSPQFTPPHGVGLSEGKCLRAQELLKDG